jgi:hypothetical protein
MQYTAVEKTIYFFNKEISLHILLGAALITSEGFLYDEKMIGMYVRIIRY